MAYRKYAGVPSPLLNIELETLNGERLSETPAVVDTGADCTTFPAAWARRLGISIEDDCIEKPCKGVGGSTPGYYYPDGIHGWVLGERLELAGAFSEGLEIVLLGRRDFFDWWTVSFDQRAKEFTITPTQQRPELDAPILRP